MELMVMMTVMMMTMMIFNPLMMIYSTFDWQLTDLRSTKNTADQRGIQLGWQTLEETKNAAALWQADRPTKRTLGTTLQFELE